MLNFVAETRYNPIIFFPSALVERETVVVRTSEFMQRLIPILAGDARLRTSVQLDTWVGRVAPSLASFCDLARAHACVCVCARARVRE